MADTGVHHLWRSASNWSWASCWRHTLVRDFPGKTVFRTIHALPLVVAPIAVGATWRLLTIPGFGLVPYYLERWFGIEYSIGRYASQAFATTVLMDIWHWTPFVTLTMLAGLSAIPKEPMEQALVDGANRWQVLRFLTIPMMMPVIITTLFIRIDGCAAHRGRGLPAHRRRPRQRHALHRHPYLARRLPSTDYGYGSAMSLLVLYFTIVLCWLLFIALSQVGKQQE